MSTTRRPEDVTDEEVRRVAKALGHMNVAIYGNLRAAIASGLLVPPPRERTQMEKDEEEWDKMRFAGRDWTAAEAGALSVILYRLFPAAKAAGVTY